MLQKYMCIWNMYTIYIYINIYDSEGIYYNSKLYINKVEKPLNYTIYSIQK